MAATDGPTWETVQQLALRDPIVQRTLKLAKHGGWSREQTLIALAVGLVTAKHTLEREAIERISTPADYRAEQFRVRVGVIATKLRHVREELRHLNKALTIQRLSYQSLYARFEHADLAHREARRQYAAWARGGWSQPLREWYRFRNGETYPYERGVRYFRWLPRWPRTWIPQP